MSVITDEVQAHWRTVRPLLSIRNEKEYDLAIERLNVLIDEVGDNEAHPLYELLDKLGEAVYAYEEKHYPMRLGTTLSWLNQRVGMQYTVIFEKDVNSYGAYVPDLPGCVAVGETKVRWFI